MFDRNEASPPLRTVAVLAVTVWLNRAKDRLRHGIRPRPMRKRQYAHSKVFFFYWPVANGQQPSARALGYRRIGDGYHEWDRGCHEGSFIRGWARFIWHGANICG